jgi:DNA-binding transcriptional ArsR family regulator
MPKSSPALDDVFRALGDATRRAVLERLARGPGSVSELAAPFAMALPSFVQHLDVLERSGLIISTKEGRVRTCRLQPKPLEKAETWLADHRAMWATRLDQLDDYLLRLKSKGRKP